MAGELGQSLAEWMIAHGAGYVVLTSRTPKVDPRFIEDMERRYRAVVKTMTLDITSRESLQSVCRTITATLPGIGGVIHGAMILDDEIFPNMTHDQFARVAKPKVLVAQLLDELFHDDTSLEFFICCSSISSIIGWSGQSNYAAANDYMSSLMCNRRKRGVAGSTISIPAVLGVGYAAHSDTFDFDYIKSIGYINIGEEDLHALFAEAVLSGRPGQPPNVKAQVAMGVNYVPADLNVRKAHRRDVRLSHFVLREGTNGEVKVQGGKSGMRVKAQLQSAKSDEEAYIISRDAFLSHLKRMLRTHQEEKVSDSLTLMEHGVDSLVAVDIRSWFLKELEVDVPTLKILGGGTIADLVKTALDKMPSLKQKEVILVPDEIAVVKVETPELTMSSSPDSAGSPILSLSQPDSSRTSEPDWDLTSFPAINDSDKSTANINVAEVVISI
ncbi:KR domain-containing protein [Hypoxylon rubiginosum]|uniref:KR domain-containing protein n=1 Tax=Hypoxylon rubiginosum TaxID=110542 RepID=A0ACB9YTM7_9PEZI|nr:KR domain-containing protein [Hypoxylon rubiginosum]